MPERRVIHTRKLDTYGLDNLPWSRAHDPLATMEPSKDVVFFLSTTRPDGRPHSARVGAIWHDGDMYFTSNQASQKARNLAQNPHATLTTHLPDLDLVLEGKVSLVSDPATLEAVAAIYRSGGWPAEVEGDALTAPYSAPSAGPAPWHVYRLVFDSAYGTATAEPYGATRWDFAAE
jgi:nitroimidazol reductase NimA-like FMN-containing flavoprotein (pyridoxamine 5'-phosphate oxidase superfamily)